MTTPLTQRFTLLFINVNYIYESEKDYDIFEKIISNFDNLDYEVRLLFVTFATSPSEVDKSKTKIIQIIDPSFNDDMIDLTSE